MNAASRSSSSRALPKSTPASNSGCAVEERGPWAAVARRDGVVRKRCRREPQPRCTSGGTRARRPRSHRVPRSQRCGSLAGMRLGPPFRQKGNRGHRLWTRAPCICTTGLGQRVRAVSALMGCARSERPARRLCRSDETRVPDERDPLQASVRRACRESSKRSSASIGADARIHGGALVRSRLPA